MKKIDENKVYWCFKFKELNNNKFQYKSPFKCKCKELDDYKCEIYPLNKNEEIIKSKKIIAGTYDRGLTVFICDNEEIAIKKWNMKLNSFIDYFKEDIKTIEDQIEKLDSLII